MSWVSLVALFCLSSATAGDLHRPAGAPQPSAGGPSSAASSAAPAGHLHSPAGAPQPSAGGPSSAASSAAPFALRVNVSLLSTMSAPALVSWENVSGAGAGDWLGVVCLPSQNYFWWMFTSGAPSGSAPISLFANGKASACDSIAVAYYLASAGNVLAGISPAIQVAPMIQQVRLSPTTSDPTAVVVDFVSSSPSPAAAHCSYGTSPFALTRTVNASSAPFATIGTVSHALLTRLAPNTRYYYTCGDAGATSELLSFVAAPEPAARPFTMAVFADFGVDDGFGLAQIQADAAAGAFDMILHAGDFAYDFESDNSANGNFFLNRASTYSSSFPTAVVPGNHESSANFTEYQVRHSGVGANANTGSALFYSFDLRAGTPTGVHVLAFNSETYIDGGIEEMLNFMAADLAAVNRSLTPWVVSFSHKLWWMDATTQTEIVKILQEGRVDVNFAGHWHFYQRYLAYDPTTATADVACMSPDNHTYSACKYVIPIISAAPGDVERNDACPGDASVAPITPACTSSYGYGTLAIFNATTALWNFTAQATPIGEGRVPFRTQGAYNDYAWIVRAESDDAAAAPPLEG